MQWTNCPAGSSQGNNTDLKNYAASKGTTWEDEETQLEFMISYLTGTGEAAEYATYGPNTNTYFGVTYDKHSWEEYDETGDTETDIDYLTRAFMATFEVPAEATCNISKRISSAKEYYNEFHGKSKPTSSSGGTETSSSTAGIKGYYTAATSGNKYTLYWQNITSSAWYSKDGCFHCSIATIISGFGSTKTPNQLTGFSYGEGCKGNRNDFSTYGGCQWETVKSIKSSDIKKYLQDGQAIMFHVVGKKLTTDNGDHDISSYGHWLSLLDYKNDNGTDKVYVHDPWSTDNSYGWGNLTNIANVISEYVHVWKE